MTSCLPEVHKVGLPYMQTHSGLVDMAVEASDTHTGTMSLGKMILSNMAKWKAGALLEALQGYG